MYSKNGSIPKAETDGTDGWIEVPDAPECPEGKEVVWWYPPGWVIRDPKPWADCSWSQSEGRWVEFSLPQEITTVEVSVLESAQVNTISSSDVQTLTSEQISGLNG
jgi:hypothetical protein